MDEHITSSPCNISRDTVCRRLEGGVLLRSGETVGEVVGCAALVVGHVHGAISSVVPDGGTVRAVDGDVLVVDAQPVAVRVSVREDATLQHLVGAGLDARHQVGRCEGDLLHLGEVISRVSVQHDAANRNQWELLVGPDLRGRSQTHSLLHFTLRRHLALKFRPDPTRSLTLPWLHRRG